MQLLKPTKYWLAAMIVMMAVACSKDYYQYEQYINNGPIVYPGRPDSLKVLAGKERILLRWPVPSDQNVKGYKVFWNFGIDSLLVSGRKNGNSDSITVLLDNLTEGAYSFTVYGYDSAGRHSVGTQSIGNVYGPTFASTVFNRPFASVKKDAIISTLYVAWVGLDSKSIGTEWSYTGVDGLPANLFSPLDDSTIITSIDVTKPISYRSLFLPEKTAIDTFFTAFKSL